MMGRKKNNSQLLKEKMENQQADSDASHQSCLTEDILKNHLEKLENNITKNLEKVIADLQEKLEKTQDVAEKALKLAEENSKLIEQLKNDNTNLKTRLHTLEHEKIVSIEEQIENRTNRQLRKTLIFKGIPEKQPEETDLEPSNPNERNTNKKETWAETEEILARKIADICDDTTIENVRDMLERCHRAQDNPNFKGRGPRPIFCAFYNWKESEFVKEQFRSNNIHDHHSRIYCEQKYGPRTTVRRNQAMMLRKQLKDANQIASGYVAHPARLMVKYTRNRDERFICKRDFSKEEVRFGR